MAKPDGRIEKGQRLSTAISARAWNRAQDAADIVLGVRPGVEADGQAYSQPYIATMVQIPAATANYPHAGVAIQLTDSRPTWPSVSGVWPKTAVSTAIDFLKGNIAIPRELLGLNRQDTVYPFPFAVSVEPIAIGQTVVRCAVAGVVVAGVRVISSQHRFVSLPTRRSDEAISELTGRLETSDTGKSVLIYARAGFGLVQL